MSRKSGIQKKNWNIKSKIELYNLIIQNFSDEFRKGKYSDVARLLNNSGKLPPSFQTVDRQFIRKLSIHQDRFQEYIETSQISPTRVILTDHSFSNLYLY